MKQWRNLLSIASFLSGLGLTAFSLLMPWVEMHYTAKETGEISGYALPFEIPMTIAALSIVAFICVVQSRMSSSKLLAGWGLVGSGLISSAYAAYVLFNPELAFHELNASVAKNYSFGIYMPIAGGVLLAVAGVLEFTRRDGARIRIRKRAEKPEKQ